MRVFIVGNDAYPRSALTGCINDAVAWEKFFDGMEAIAIHDATKKQILDGLKWLSETGGIFAYSGHGTLVNNPKDVVGYSEALCPIDMDNGNLITDVELAAALIPCGKRIVCILDCCHGNNEWYSRGDGTTRNVGRFIHTENIIPLDDEDGERSAEHDRLLWADTEVTLLNACKANQSAYEKKIKEYRRGCFSYALQATYRQQGVRAWTNEAGSYIKKTLQKNGQVPRAIGKAKYLNETLIQEG